MKGLRVKCPNCGIVRHITTEHYDPGQPPRGHFVELIEPWKGWHWNCFDQEGENLSTTPAVMMTCQECSAPLVLNNRLTIVPNPKADMSLTCEICGKVCKSRAGLLAHIRSHKGKNNA